jgi:hypothetical protein
MLMLSSYRWITLGVFPAALAAAGALLLWSYFDARNVRKRQIYEAMAGECHPVWRDLDAGRICAGQAVEEVMWRTHPVRVECFEDIVTLYYHPPGFTGLTIDAKGGRLVRAGAWSCTWDWTFFDTWPTVEREAYFGRWAKHRERIFNAHQAANQVQELLQFAFLRVGGSLLLSSPDE